MDKAEYNLRFGRFLKRKRVERNWSQIDMSVEMENNFQNISRIERGEITPTIFWVDRLSKVLNCSLSELMKDFEKNEKVDQIN